MTSYDLIAIGGGSGGLACAQRAAEYGARAAVFESGRLGGTCVNVGCVPKKVMWNAAEIAHAISQASCYGFDVRLQGHDWQGLKRGRDAYVERLNGIYARNLERKSIPIIRSRARFAGPKLIVDAEGNEYRAEHVVIAAGGFPTVPALDGAELGITSDGFFELERLPERVAVVGSGYIAVELAGILNALGSRVSLFMRYDRVLRHFEAMLSEHAMKGLAAAGIELVAQAVTKGLTRKRSLTLATEDGREFAGFDEVIWAIGRTPSSAALGLGAAGIETTAGGYIGVDELQNTNVEGVYAIGDITGQAELTPVAIAAGRRLADRVFGGQTGRRLSYEMIPTVIFSHPPIGTVGLTEADARARYGDEALTVYTSEFVPMFNALTDDKPVTAMKLITVGTDERVVGCHIAGPGADEMLQGFAVALSMGARKRDLDDTVAIHPTSAEELVTMR